MIKKYVVLRTRVEFEEALKQLQELGYQIAATPGTAAFFTERGFRSITSLSKPTEEVRGAGPTQLTTTATTIAAVSTALQHVAHDEASLNASDASPGSPPMQLVDAVPVQGRDQGAVLDWIRAQRIDLVINIPEGSTRGDEITSGYLMRRTAVDFGCSLLTNIK